MRTKTSKQPHFKKHPLTVAVQACCYTLLGGLPLANANPTGGQVVGGSGTISQSGTNTTINQATQNLAINWQTFNVQSNERVQFVQPNASAIALNRILSNNGSTIAGRIDANGKVILVNPNGIFFTSTASLNVGSLIASGLDINPSDFMNGKYVFNEISGTSGTVINQGLISASLGGNLALIGKQVKNEGLIQANLGTVTLAAGKEAVLTFDNDGLLGVRVTKEILQSELGVDPAVINSGEIQAQGGRVLLTASQSQDVFSRAVNTGGLEPATSVVVNDDGTFTLGSGADVLNTGNIDTSTTSSSQNAGRIALIGENVISGGTLRADAADGNGGEIELHARDMTLLTENSLTSARSESNGNGGIVKVLGDKVGLFDQSTVDVSGSNGGGQALFGGDFQGKNVAMPNATATIVDRHTRIFADALQNGDGGKVILWADDTTRFLGSIFTRGGTYSGNGGFVETSGKNYLLFDGTADRTAANGQSGLLLLDPNDIFIATSTVNNTTNVSAIPLNATTGDYTIAFSSNGTDDITITPTTLQNTLALGDVLLQAQDDIHVNSSVTTASTNSLTLEARDDININAPITMGGGNLTLRADTGGGGGNVILFRGIDTNGGDLFIYGNDFDGTSFSQNGNIINVTVNTGNNGNATINLTGDARLGGMVVGGNLAVTAGTSAGTGITQGQDNPSNDVLSVTGTSTFTSNGTDRDITLSNSNDLRGAISLTTNGGYQANASLTNTSATTTLNNIYVDGNLTVNATQNLTVTGTVEGRGTDGVGTSQTTTLGLNFGRDGSDSTFTATGATIREGAALSNDSVNINITGGNGNNTFNINNATIATINGAFNTNRGITIGGGTGNDIFNIATNINGLFSGGDGNDRFNINASGIAIYRVEGNAGTNTLASGVATVNSWQLNNTDSGTLTNGGFAVNFIDIANLVGGTGQDNFIINNGTGALSGLLDGGAGGADTLTITNSAQNDVIQLSATDTSANLTVNRVETITANSARTATNRLIAADTTDNVWSIGASQTTNTVSDGSTTTTFSNFASVQGGNHTAMGSEQFTVNAVITQTSANSVTNINTGNGTTGVTVNAGANVSGTITTGTGTNTVAVRGVAGAIDGTANGNNTVAVYAGGTVTNAINTGSGIDIITVGEASILAPAATVSSINAGGGADNVTVHAGASVTNDIVTGAGADIISVSGAARSIDAGAGNDQITLASPGVITGVVPTTTVGVVGGGDDDSLSVSSAGNTWALTTTTDGTVSNSGPPAISVSFSGIENFNTGGTGATLDYGSVSGNVVVNLNRFSGFSTVIGSSVALTSTIIGRDSTTNNWYIGQVVGNLDSRNDGTNDGLVTYGPTIGSTSINFINFNRLTGGAAGATNNFYLTDATPPAPTLPSNGLFTGIITGGNSSVNQLTARDLASTWSINAINSNSTLDYNSGTGPTTTTFNGIQNLIGASSQNDTFNFNVTPAVAAVSVDGRGQVVNTTGDTVSFAGLINQVVSVQLGATGFNGIEGYTGNGTDSTLTGSNTINNWNINAANEGTFNDSTSTIAFSGFNNLTGGTAADTFTLAATGSISGLIDGAGGTDTLSIFVPSITVDLGNRATANLNVDRVETISALANSNNTVTGDNVVNSWNITATNQVTVGPVTLLGFGNLVGGTNNDTFIYQVGGSLTGQINGNLGTDTVNLSALAVVNVTLGASGFSSIENLIGNNTASTLTGSVTTNTWSINAANGGTVSDGTTTTAFSGFNNLTGGANTDNFTLSGAGSLTGLIDGAGGTDSLNITIAGNQTVELGNRSTSALNVYRVETITGNSGAGITNTLVADNNTNSWTLNGTNSGSVNDGVNATTFSNFANVTGGSATDNFNLASGTISGLIDGAGGADSLTITASGNQTVELGTSINANLNVYQVETITANNSATNTLIGSNTANTWTINGSNGGNVTDGNVTPTTTTFLNFQNVVGGSAIDLFTVSNSGSIASISGGVGNDEFSIGGAVTTLNGNAGVDTVTVNTNGSVTTVNLGEGNDQFVINAGSVGTVNGDAGNDTFTVVGGNVTTIDGGFEADSSPGTDYVTYTQAGVQVTVGDNIGIGGVTVRNVEGINANNGILNARNGVTTTWTIDGLNAGRVEDTGGEGLSFTGFSILNGGADADDFIVTRSTDNTTNGRITGTINGNGGTNTLTVLLTGAEIGSVSYVGTGNDTVTIGGTTGTYNGAYTPGVNLSSYDQLVYTSTTGMEFTTNYVGVDTVETNHNLVNLTVNGSANPETIELGNGTFTVGAHTPVDFGSTVTNLTLNGQGGSDIINFNNAIFSGTALTLTAEFVTGNTLSANTLVLDNVGQFGADGTPVTTTINTLQLVNSGAVYINETDGLTLNTTGSVTNSGIFTIANATTINTNGGSLILNNASNDFDTVFTTGTNGSINLTDVDGIAGGDMRASSITLNTAGNVTLQTHTADLTINNSSAGNINVSNDQAVQIDLTTTGNINFTNTAGTVVVERLYTNGSGYYAAAGSVVNLTTSGAVFAYTGAGSHSPFDAPDIVGETVIVNIQGDLGVIYPGRNMSISVSNRFGFYSPGRGYVHYFAGEPPIVDNPEDLIVFSGLAGITSQQLLEVESLDEFDPAIFTEVRNYYYEDVAIMMPADQRLDGSDEDEKEQEKEGKL